MNSIIIIVVYVLICCVLAKGREDEIRIHDGSPDIFTEVSYGLRQDLQANTRNYVKLVQCRFLPHLVQFIIK
jgi:hypothetical protein